MKKRLQIYFSFPEKLKQTKTMKTKQKNLKIGREKTLAERPKNIESKTWMEKIFEFF